MTAQSVFFDSFLPTRSTFGVDLTSYDRKRHGKDDKTVRVALIDEPGMQTMIYDSSVVPVRTIHDTLLVPGKLS